ncbi:oxidoreductase [Angustibacter sp. McL0619]|uniref:oxidoreductase n=1 Tax=Angustibacter sp. McL0619 TaxID=3415676 RepID=UPI003CEDFDA6
MTTHDPVLVTGCSSGIGRAVALELLANGHTVYATARRPETLDELVAAGAKVLALDVTDEASMAAAVRAVEAEHGQVGTLVNNAGYGEYGAVEEVSMDAVRRQFETNVFGLSRLIQLALPAMREAGRGRIVNIGSMGGRITFPAGGYYHASKYAVEAISDALRVEVAQFGIDVVLVEPGMIRTGFGEVAAGTLDSTSTDGSSPYDALRSSADKVMADGYRGPFSVPPGKVAQIVRRAVEAERPRSRYLITPAARAMVALRRFGGDRAWDAFVRRQFSVTGRGRR